MLSSFIMIAVLLVLVLRVRQVYSFSPGRRPTNGRVADSSSFPSCRSALSSSATDAQQHVAALPLPTVPQHILDHLDAVYPPADAAHRNALSRTDGYWPFVHKGQAPPMELTYGEFDVHSLAAVLQEALLLLSSSPTTTTTTTSTTPPPPPSWHGKVFTDIGSGTGRMVLAAAALHPTLALSRGVELLPSLHDTAVDAARQQQQHILEVAPVQLVCASFEDACFADSDCVFCFSTCMKDVLESLAHTIVQQCRPGTVVITTDYALPAAAAVRRNDSSSVQIQQVQERSTGCALIGGDCMVYFHRVEKI